MNASTFTARVVTSTGADVAAALSAAVGALSGPLHGGAPSRVLKMLDEVEREGDAERYVKDAAGPRRPADGLRPPRLPRRGPARARAAAHGAGDRLAALRRSPRRSSAAALAELKARKPDRVLATNVEFWSAVVLDYADVPADLFTPMFACARVAGWSAHILEQKRERPADPADGEVRRAAGAAAASERRGPGACRARGVVRQSSRPRPFLSPIWPRSSPPGRPVVCTSRTGRRPDRARELLELTGRESLGRRAAAHVRRARSSR